MSIGLFTLYQRLYFNLKSKVKFLTYDTMVYSIIHGRLISADLNYEVDLIK